MFFLVMGTSTVPTEIILSEEETEEKSTSFTSTVDLESTDEGFASSVVGGSLIVLMHFTTSFMAYPSPVCQGNSSTWMGFIMP